MRISIKPTEQFNREIVETFKAIEEGRAVPQGPEISFASLDVFRQFFTEKRLEMLHVIRHRRPGSVYALAKLLKRDFKSVHADLKRLAQLGLVRVRRQKAKTPKGYRAVPVVGYDRIILEMAV